MVFMLIFWIILLLAGFIYIFFRQSNRLGFYKVENIIVPLIILAVAFIIVAIATNDPLFANFGVPQEFEWVVGLFIAAFAAWKIYFDPIKKKVINAEKDTAVMKSDIKSIKSDLSLIKDKILG